MGKTTPSFSMKEEGFWISSCKKWEILALDEKRTTVLKNKVTGEVRVFDYPCQAKVWVWELGTVDRVHEPT